MGLYQLGGGINRELCGILDLRELLELFCFHPIDLEDMRDRRFVIHSLLQNTILVYPNSRKDIEHGSIHRS